MQHSNIEPLDFSCILDIQRKNMKAFSEASMLAFEFFQTVVTRQTEFYSEIAKDASSLLENPTEHADINMLTKSYEKYVKHWHELGSIIKKSGKETSDVINDSVAPSLTEMKSVHDKHSGKHSKQKKST